MTFGKIIEDCDLVSSLEKRFRADAANVTCTAGNEDFHGLRLIRVRVFRKLLLEFQYHLLNVWVPFSRFQNFQAFFVRAILQDLDSDVSRSPSSHEQARRHIEVDSIFPDKR